MPNVMPRSADNLTYTGSTNVSAYNNNPNNITIHGVLPELNFAADVNYNFTFPGQSSPTHISPYAMVFQGYFVAPSAATWTISMDIKLDDYGWVWSGTTAYTQWSSTNFGARSLYNVQYGNISFTLAQGGILPVTFLWMNLGANGKNIINIVNGATSTTYNSTIGFFQSTPCDPNFPYAPLFC